MVGFIIIIVFFNLINMFYINLCFLIRGIMFFRILRIWCRRIGIFLRRYFICDKYSGLMVLLSRWIIGLIFLSLSREYEGSDTFFKKIVFLGMLGVLCLFFISRNFLGLYFFFEIRLIPTYFLVVYWGGSYERIEASFYLFIYIIFISFPLLIYVIKIYDINYRLDIGLNVIPGINKFMYLILRWEYLLIFGAFFIKLPVFLFHVWLPKAHVEAPVYGSMLLAAVLLKLGRYGLLRVILIFGDGCVIYRYLVIRLRMLGGVFIRFLCITQVDMKRLVAYSSVVHINIILASLFTIIKIGFIGGFIAIVSHGLCSSGLFFIVNSYYRRSFRRLLILNNGLSRVLSTLIFWWFLLCASNFSFPFSLNFIGEVLIIITLIRWDYTIRGLIGLICFFRGAYSLYLFSSIFHGEANFNVQLNEGVMAEHLRGLLHYRPILLGILNLHLFI